MPTNLNALIRYKQIDTCLKNPHIECTIGKLQEFCTSALGEFRGVYKKVSERTIRDDIRVMRSEMLGFNAPIEFQDGKYFYSNQSYSIFSVPISDIALLKSVFNLLVKERDHINDDELHSLLERIAAITGDEVPKVEDRDIMFKIDDEGEFKEELDRGIHYYLPAFDVESKLDQPSTMVWDEILSVI